MSTVTITGLTKDGSGQADSRDWRGLSPTYRQGSDGSVVTTREQVIRVVAGVFTAQLEPGPMMLINPDGKRYSVIIPNEDADLWDVIAIAAAYPPDSAQEALYAAVVDYLEAQDVYRKPGLGIPKADLTAAVQASLSKADASGTYTKPGSGVPKSDLATAVQTSLDKADAAYTKPGTGIPKSDMATAVQTSLAAADASTAATAFWLALAANPDQLVTGTITRSGAGAATGFSVAWPDGATGTFAGTESTVVPGAIDSYTVTHVLSGVTKTYTQAALTRDSTGAVTNRPALVVS